MTIPTMFTIPHVHGIWVADPEPADMALGRSVHADFTPYSDDLPWCMVPEKKDYCRGCEICICPPIIQGTSYDPYVPDTERKQHARRLPFYRCEPHMTFLSLIQINDDRPAWISRTAISWSGLHLHPTHFNVHGAVLRQISRPLRIICSSTTRRRLH